MIFAWLRRLFFGKRLDEIISVFERTQDELSLFMERTQVKRERLQAKIDAMTESHDKHGDLQDQASLLHTNLNALRTQHVATVEPDAEQFALNKLIDEHMPDPIMPQMRTKEAHE